MGSDLQNRTACKNRTDLIRKCFKSITDLKDGIYHKDRTDPEVGTDLEDRSDLKNEVTLKKGGQDYSVDLETLTEKGYIIKKES